MSFTTLTFLVFLVVVFALHWIARGRVGQNLVIVAASYAFYGWWDPRFCALILASSLVDYGLARAIEASRAGEGSAARAKLGLALSCVANLGVLALFKYFDFFVASALDLAGAFGVELSAPTLRLILPVGISFYTFQTLGYTIDVYRGESPACRRLLDYLAYVAFFPQLVAGPIERARRLLPQLERARSFDGEQARDGLRLMLWGLVKKLALADHLGGFVDQLYPASGAVHGSGPALMLATAAFAFQIYLDFSAYSDIAIGCARLFGVRLVRNFALPYFSRDLGEFWRRWHMSLSTWFRDYVYLPLGGSRRGPARFWLALMATFTLSGLWHGASWTFVIWGVVNGLLVGLVHARGGRSRGPAEPPYEGVAGLVDGLVAALESLRTFALIGLSWVLFRAVDLAQAAGVYLRMGEDLLRPEAWAELALYAEFWAAFGPLLAIFVIVEFLTRARPHPLAAIEGWPRPLRWLLYTALIWTAIYLHPDDPEAFIYFQF